jgi:hypothetical protein
VGAITDFLCGVRYVVSDDHNGLEMGKPEPPNRVQTDALRKEAWNTREEIVQADASGNLHIQRTLPPGRSFSSGKCNAFLKETSPRLENVISWYPC